MTTADDIRAWMRRVMAEKELTPAAWARRAGVAPSTIQRAIKEDYAFITSSRTLAKLAGAAGVTPPSVDAPLNQREPATFLSIRHEVGAGVWRMVDDMAQVELGTAPVFAEPAYADFPQWLERVIGDSMDEEYPEGTLLHIVDTIALGYAPRAGDHVIVERRRDQGGTVERTVKEVTFGPGGRMQLIARSKNPRWRANPVVVLNGHDQDNCEVQVVGLVLGSYRRRRPI